MKSTRKFLFPGAIAALLLALGLVVRAPAQQQPGPNDAAFRGISNKLLCQCGTCNYMVLSCNHLDCPSATYIRSTIQKDLAAGQSEDVILASFVQEYGVKVLAEPPRHGLLGWMAWLMPFFGLGLGGCAVFYVLSRWAGHETARGASAGSSAADREQDALLEKYRTQIDREIEKD